MKRIKRTVALCILTIPAAAFAAGGSATGTITNLFVDAGFANVIYVTLSGVKTGNPACSTSTRGQFVIPANNGVADYVFMFTLATTAAISGKTVTVTGQNQCNVDNAVETIQNIKIG